MKLKRTLALVVLGGAAVWLVLAASGYGQLAWRRVQTTAAKEAQVTCGYWHALGTHEFNAFTTAPDTIECPSYVGFRWPAPPPRFAEETQWAKPLATRQAIDVTCRFARLPANAVEPGDRYNADAPLRLMIDWRGERVAFADPKDASDFGPPLREGSPGSLPRQIWLKYEAGDLPLFKREKPGRVWLLIAPATGLAQMMLITDKGFVRHGGCRPA
jgi:hypothetical protein